MNSKAKKINRYEYPIVKEFIQKKHGTLITISEEYLNSNSIIEIICNVDGNQWKTKCKNVVGRNNWCERCARNKYSPEQMRIFIESKNGRLLSEIYIGGHRKFNVKCNKCGHEWATTTARLTKGAWCYNCSVARKYSIEDVKSEIERRNGKLLSEEYVNIKSKMLILCLECGSKWRAIFDSILNQKTWCPICSDGKTQRFLFSIVKDIFLGMPVEYNYSGFDWLKTDAGGKQKIDIFIPHLKLAIEYDGEQHFIPVRFGNMKTLDQIKNDKIKKHNDDVKYLIRIDYKEKNDLSLSFVLNKLLENGIGDIFDAK